MAVLFRHNNRGAVRSRHAGIHDQTSAVGLLARAVEFDGRNDGQHFDDCEWCVSPFDGDRIHSRSVFAFLSVLVSPARPSPECISNGGMDAFHSPLVTFVPKRCTYIQLSIQL